MPIINYAGIFLGAALVGYVIFLLILKLLPTRLTAGHLSQKSEVLVEARKHADSIRRETELANESKIQILKEELESALSQREEDLKLAESDLDLYEKQLAPVATRIQKLEHDVKQVEQHTEFAKSNYEQTAQAFATVQTSLRSELEQRSNSDANQMLKNITSQLAETRQLEAQKL